MTLCVRAIALRACSPRRLRPGDAWRRPTRVFVADGSAKTCWGGPGERQDGRRRRRQERRRGLGATRATLRVTGSRLRCRLSLEARLRRTRPGVHLRQMRPSVGVKEVY